MLLHLLLLLQDPQLPPPSARPPRVEAEIVVDGRLDEPVWRDAARLDGFRQYRPVDGRAAEERTEVLVWYGPTALHVGIVAHDRAPGQIRATVADRDRIGADDNVTLYLDTFSDRRRAFVFGVNPLGIQEDGVLSEGAGGGAGSLGGGTLDRSPDFIWQSRGQVTDSGWVVELRIPFKSLRYPGGGTQDWGFNVLRTVRRTGYEDTWSDVRRANASFLAQAGRLEGLHDLRSGLTTEVQPYVSGVARGDREAEGWARGRLDRDAGLNVRLSRTNLALDLTLNPDFSQVLPDFGLVTVNERFALFIPERREFFLEGIDLFTTPNQLVYTRQVADPLVGAKFTGKFGRLGAAYLGALDELPGDDAAFNIGRVRYDLGRNSLVGATLTSRETEGAHNRVAAADARIVFARLYFAQAQLGRAWTRDADGTERAGSIWQAEADRTGRSWGWNVQLTGIAPEFETQAGFVNRRDLIQFRVFHRLTWYGARGAPLEQVSFFLNPRRIWQYRDTYAGGDAIEGAERASVEARVRGNWNVTVAASRSFFLFDPATYAGYAVGGPDGGTFTPARRATDLFGGELQLASPTWRRFDASTQVIWRETALFGEAGEGTELRATANVGLRPTRSVRVAGALTLTDIARRSGEEFARTVLPRVTLEFQPVRQLFFRAFVEYRDDRRAAFRDPATGLPLFRDGTPVGGGRLRAVRADVLAQFLPSPGTVAYVGYGADWDGAQSADPTRLTRARDRLFVKLAYLVRR